MPSHLGHHQNDERPSDVSCFDVMANDQADIHAGEVAACHQIPDDIANNIITNIELSTSRQKRYAIILINLPERPNNKGERPTPVPRIKLDQLMLQTKHTVSIENNRIKCILGLNNFNMNDTSCKHWL